MAQANKSEKQSGDATPTVAASAPHNLNPVLDLSAITSMVEATVLKKMTKALNDAVNGLPTPLTEIEVLRLIESTEIDLSALASKKDMAAAVEKMAASEDMEILLDSKADAAVIEEVQAAITANASEIDGVKKALALKVNSEEFAAFAQAAAKKAGITAAEAKALIEEMARSGAFATTVANQALNQLLEDPTAGKRSEAGERFDSHIGGMIDARGAELTTRLDKAVSDFDEVGEALPGFFSKMREEEKGELQSRYALHRLREPGVGFFAFASEVGLGVHNWYMRPVGSLVRVPVTYALLLGGTTLLSSTLLANQSWAQHWLFRFGLPAVLTIANELIAWKVRSSYYDGYGYEPQGPALRKEDRKRIKEARKEAREAKKIEAKAKA